MSRTLKALLVGYQGFGNVGDEAILAGIELVLGGTVIRVDWVVCGPQPVTSFSNAIRIRTRRGRPSLAGVRALRRADLLLFSGGGLLHDHWPAVVPTYLAWSLLARASGTRIAWVGVGIGPLRGHLARRLAGWTLRLADLITVRDVESAELVGEVAPGAPVTVVPDPAVFIVPPVTGTNRQGVGIIVRLPTPSQAQLGEHMARELGKAAARLSADGRTVTLLTFGGTRDREVAEAVAVAATRAGGARPAIEELGPDPLPVLTRLAALEGVISVRLHGLILAAVAQTPVVGVSYDPKVGAWASRLGLERGVPLTDLDATMLLKALARNMAEPVVSGVARRVANLRREMGTVRALLTGLDQ